MRFRHLMFAALFLTLPAISSAQGVSPLAANAKVQLGLVTGFIVRAAEKVPEDLYAFRATPDVRSMGQLFGHVADALFSMCSAASGSKPTRTGIEKSVTTKPALVAALKEGVSHCNSVIDTMTDQKVTETVPFIGGQTPRVSVLYFAVAHAYEHYGNLVTYMRLKNIVPPSSEPKPAQ